MSYFAAALSNYLDRSGISQIYFANLAEIEAPNLSRYLKGRIPSKEMMERLVRSIPERERAAIVAGYLKDLTPESAWDLIEIQPAEPYRASAGKSVVKFPKAIQEDFDYIFACAQHNPAVVDSIRSTVRILKGL